MEIIPFSELKQITPIEKRKEVMTELLETYSNKELQKAWKLTSPQIFQHYARTLGIEIKSLKRPRYSDRSYLGRELFSYNKRTSLDKMVNDVQKVVKLMNDGRLYQVSIKIRELKER